MLRICLLFVFGLAGCSLLEEEPKLFAKNFDFVHSAKSFSEMDRVRQIPEVRKELDKYLSSGQRTLKVAMENRENYAFVEDVFREEGIPLWLSSLGIVESGFNPAAKNPSGAKGIWQFTKQTATSYGLKVNFVQDQRSDPKKSTVAVAKHLSDLHAKYKDWNLVLAAYNAGAGKVSTVIKKAGTNDFWKLARNGYFSKQTTNFVPKVLAAAVITSKPQQYGF